MKKENKSIESINNIEDYFTETSSGLDIEANNIECNCITSRNNNFSVDSSGNINCNSINTNSFNFDAIYPVGSIYMNISDINPNNVFVGTWVKIEGRFLLSSSTDYLVGNTGGEANHTLSIDEMPSHNHSTYDIAPGLYQGWGNESHNGWVTASTQGQGGTWDVSYMGGSQPHNNMPPYLVVNMWKRIN